MIRPLILLVSLSSATAAIAEPARIAWIGLDRGPLSPSDAAHLEALIIDELDGYDSFRLVDASGHALDVRLMASEAALVARLKKEGIDRALSFQTEKAIRQFDRAIAVFETRLVQLLDYELLHDALLAKAEVQCQSGNKAAAKATLKQLAALSPQRPPTTRTHPVALVKLWENALAEIGPVGSISVQCDECRIQLDGQALGPGPMIATRVPPGKHYLVARWTHGYSYDTVQVAPGRETKTKIERTGPGEEARRAMLATIERRAGLDEAVQATLRSIRLAQSEGALVVAIKNDAGGKRSMLIARHGAQGELTTLVQAPLDEKIEDERTSARVKQIGALLFVEQRRGSIALSSDGTITAPEGLVELMFNGIGARPPAPIAEPPPPDAMQAPPSEAIVQVPLDVPPATTEESPLVEQWWFWTIIAGVAVVGTGVGLGVWAGTRDPSTTRFEVILP